MKKIGNMKHVLYTAALLAIVAGCAKELDKPAPEEKTGLIPFSFTAVMVDEPVTEATIADNGTFAWSEGDEIALYNTVDDQFYPFTCEDGDGLFNGEAPANASFSVAYYPASVAKTETSVTLPDTYSATDAQAGKVFPMVATPDGNQLAFTHLGALLKFTVNDIPASATTLTVSSDAAITGDFTPSVADGKKVIAAGSGSASIAIPLSLTETSSLSFYVPLPVGSYNYTIAVSDGTHTMLEKGTTAAKTIDRASLHKMKPLTVVPPTTDKKLRGRYNVDGAYKEWGDDSLVDFSPVDGHWGWFKASVSVPDYRITFKLYTSDGNAYTGNTKGNGRKVVRTLLPVAGDGQGDDFDVFTNHSDLDVYFDPTQNLLFTLPAGEAFVVPTTVGGEEVDQYALIGWHLNNDWNSDFFLEGVYGFDDWRVVRIGARGDTPHFTFQFRRNGGWSECIGGIYDYHRNVNTRYYARTSNRADISVYPGVAGDYDVYLKKDYSTIFILPAGTAFNVPGRGEQEDLVSILSVIGGINGTNWSTAYPLEFASADNHEWYALKNAYKISGWGAMVFKLYNGGWGKGVNIGWPWDLNGAIGDMNTLYPLWLRDGDDDIPNIQLGTDGGNVDIYIKADLSQIFTLSAGSPFVIPGNDPATAPKAVFIGDSITYFWNNADRGNPSFFTTNNLVTKGVEGQTSATIKNRFNYDAITPGPEKVHILCGANDLAGNGGVYVTPAEICQNIADMASAAKTAGIDVLIGSVLPCNYFWWNTSVNPANDIVTVNNLLKTLCTDNGYTYVNYYDSMVHSNGTGGMADAYNIDGCHPSKAGYTVMENIVLPLLQ